MKKQLKFVFVALLVTLACTLVGCNAPTEESADLPPTTTQVKESMGLEFALNDDQTAYIVTGIGACTDTHVVIPDTHLGKPVVGISSSAFKDCTQITKITIPDSITDVSDSSFEGCIGINILLSPTTTIHKASTWITDTPAGCESDGSKHRECTDEGCGKVLETAIIPQTGHTESGWVIDIPAGCESDGSKYTKCTNEGCGKILETAIIPQTGHTESGWMIDVPAGCENDGSQYKKCTVEDCGAILETELLPASGHNVGALECENCHKPASQGLVFYPLGDGTCRVGDLGDCTDSELLIPSVSPDGLPVSSVAFWNCSSITSIVLPNSVTNIPANAFSGCSNLTSITIPDSVTSIGSNAFSGCSSLASVKIPDGIKIIENSVFYGCKSLTSVTIPDGVTSIGENAFKGCTNLASITIPNSVTSIGRDAFRDCANLIQTENGVQYVNNWVVDCDLTVTSVTLRTNTVGISDYAFEYCEDLASINLSSVLKNIGDHAFRDCFSLTSIIIPDGVTCISPGAFYDCYNLRCITMPISITIIDDAAFEGCTLLSTIYYCGTVYDWVKISIIGKWNSAISLHKRYFYSESEPTDTNYKYWHYDENGNPVAWEPLT